MGRLKSFNITLDENKTVFHPGELVKGKCVVNLKGDLRVRCLRVCVRGTAKVHWTESRSTGTRLGPTTEHFNAEIGYFSRKTVLFGRSTSSNSNEWDVLQEGQHEFEFSFELPVDGISTSFEGKHGNIRYWLKADLEKLWGFNSKTKKAFTVINPVDINQPQYLLPVEKSIEKTLCCWVCTSGPISISARTDRQGFCAGESVAISADFENHSSRTVIPYASLHQNQTFYANGKARMRTSKFNVLTGLPVSAGSRAVWDAQLLKIPAVSPSILNCCIIKVEYYIKLAVNIPGSYNLSLNLPIVVGTVPFRGMMARHAQRSPLPEPPPYEELLPSIDDPPTYMESVEGPVSILDEDDDLEGMEGDCTYTPMYVYVHNYVPPPAYSEVDPSPVLEASALNVDSAVTRL